MSGIDMPQHLLIEIGKLLRQGRTARGNSLAVAAHKIQVSVDWLVAVENGQQSISDVEVAKILNSNGNVRGDEIERLIFEDVVKSLSFNEAKKPNLYIVR